DFEVSVEMAMEIDGDGEWFAVEGIGAQDGQAGINRSILASAIESHAPGFAGAYPKAGRLTLAPCLDNGLGGGAGDEVYVIGIQHANSSHEGRSRCVVAVRAIDTDRLGRNGGLSGDLATDDLREIVVAVHDVE